MSGRIETLELAGITKRFGRTLACDGVSLSVKAGEILALLGENGAGKSTLMNVLFGIIRPDAGKILINGREARIRNPGDAIAAGISMVHQHFMLVGAHTVAENVVLGMEGAPFIDPAGKARRRIAGLSEKFGLKVDPDARIWELSAGEQQRVEILKALMRGGDLLILDEPTSVLTPQEAQELFAILRKLAADGHAVIFISHKLDEIMELCSRVVVLRHGRVTGGAETRGITKAELAGLMLGREFSFRQRGKGPAAGEVVLEVKDLVVRGDRGLDAVRGVSFQVRAGEILGVAGVSGNGQRELVEAVAGMRRAERGRIIVAGREAANRDAKSVFRNGVSHIPEERMRFGIAPNLTISENSVLKSYDREPYSRSFLLDSRTIRSFAERLVADFRVAARSIDVPIKALSGGNIQKVIAGRELSENSRLILAAHPTYGLDAGAAEFLRDEIFKRKEAGAAVLLVSEDIEELLELSDRIAVMFEGRLMGVVPAGEARMEELGLMMTGSKSAAEAAQV